MVSCIIILYVLRRKSRVKNEQAHLPTNTNTYIPQRLTMLSRDNQHMTPGQGHNVQKRKDCVRRKN